MDHGVCYLQHTIKLNGNHGEKDKHRQEQRARKQLTEVGGGAVKGGVEERLWLVGVHTELICAVGVNAGFFSVGNQFSRDCWVVTFELCICLTLSC